jgi:hypothetical protein
MAWKTVIFQPLLSIQSRLDWRPPACKAPEPKGAPKLRFQQLVGVGMLVLLVGLGLLVVGLQYVPVIGDLPPIAS